MEKLDQEKLIPKLLCMIGNEKRKEFTMKMLLIYYLIKRNFRFFLRNQNNETNKNSVGNSDQIMNLL